MDRNSYHRLVRGEARGPGAALARLGLRIASIGYGAGVRLRNARFDRGRGVDRAEVPVVAIGNITVGGTGKTPMVEYACRRFRERGLRVAILSRGYGATEGLNDEGLVLDANLPDVPHFQDPDRVALARIAVEECESQVLVLDDGFQHRRLARDLDVVLLDALDPFGLGHLLPRGLLREPVGSLRRAGVVVLSRADLVSRAERNAIRSRAERAAGPLRWAEARHAPRDLLDADANAEPIDRLREGPVVAFCGLGNPEGFRRTLIGLGADLIAFRTFPDHHPYDRADVEGLIQWARDWGAALALTTQKDSVKLRLSNLGPVPLRAVRIGLEPIEGGDVLDGALDRIAEQAR
ncbi:tetraacyldisaccharide 4'-kinase [Tautonia sociabilis]|uniref:Tetraacyldisaccharide 4'-kinase n=1 Tax=Tautonia sociabilis TaxID=2080755 RepID=A0A432MHX6_9BACT|nr:tetraacyldisaccharide 4'-kinase [Tautonia sociabilis]RUL86742.1 tetraacyldisaccharide 4'-kinase [Tautonia sociabilis]